jgi:uncharacterized protein
MEIEQFNRDTKGFFKASEQGTEAGVMTYTWAGTDKMIIDHTEVDPKFKGLGIGKKLLMELVKYARENQVKVVPICPFARSVFDKVKDIRDVLL